jgi:predicted nucleic acid-binding protein
MIIVADTSPLNYLVLINEIGVLQKMYPTAVRAELQCPPAPELVRLWISDPPSWLEVRTPIGASDPSLNELDPGERDAILLAMELRADN